MFKNVNHHTLRWVHRTTLTVEFQAQPFRLLFGWQFSCVPWNKSHSLRRKTSLRQKGSGWVQRLGKVFFPNVGTSKAETTSTPALGTQHRPWRAKPKQLKQTRHKERQQEKHKTREGKNKIMFHNQKQNLHPPHEGHCQCASMCSLLLHQLARQPQNGALKTMAVQQQLALSLGVATVWRHSSVHDHSRV